MDRARASDMLRRARRAAGVSQAQLAELAGTSQSAIAAYELGGREPTLPVLERMIRASGHLLDVVLKPDPRLFRLADLSKQIQGAPHEQRRMRLVFEFLRSAAEDGGPLPLLVAAEPDLTGDARFDALLAAIAEDLCVHGGIAPPAWVHDRSRFLDGFWWVSDLPSDERAATRAVDALFQPDGPVLAAALEVAEELELPRSWLNNQASSYVSGRAGRGTPVYDHPNLRVLTTPPEHLLAMKLRAARAVRDAEDLRLLLDALGLRTPAEAIAIVERFFPGEPLSDRSRQLLEDLLSESSQ